MTKKGPSFEEPFLFGWIEWFFFSNVMLSC
nr:MAG TPA: hypothetical protein [Caudoviricetes sp.]